HLYPVYSPRSSPMLFSKCLLAAAVALLLLSPSPVFANDWSGEGIGRMTDAPSPFFEVAGESTWGPFRASGCIDPVGRGGSITITMFTGEELHGVLEVAHLGRPLISGQLEVAGGVNLWVVG